MMITMAIEAMAEAVVLTRGAKASVVTPSSK